MSTRKPTLFGKKRLAMLLCFILIWGLVGSQALAVDYTSYSGFTTSETPVLPSNEVHPSLWFSSSEISSMYAKRNADSYTSLLWDSISSSPYLTMSLPSAPSCQSNLTDAYKREVHQYYGDMSRIAKYNAFMYIMEGNNTYKNRAINALKRAYDGPIYSCSSIEPTVSGSPIDETYRAVWAQSFAAAYDWVQDQLSSSDNTSIRNRLATEAQAINDNIYAWGPRPHNHRSKPAWGLGTLALVLSDHSSASTWLQTALEAANTNTSYFFSSDGVYREGSQYWIYSHINLVPFLYHYKNVSGVNLFPTYKPAFLWEFHVSNNNGWMPNVADSYLRHNFSHMVASQYMTSNDSTPLHPTAKWGNLLQWRYKNTNTEPWGGEFGNNTGASYDDTMDIDKYLTYDPSISSIAPTGTGTKFFNEGGQTIFRNNWLYNHPSSRYLLFHGVAEADNHNHFDHLSFIIHAENQMMASDSGYSRSSYGESIRRTWYRTAEAHNTITLNGKWPVDTAENTTPKSSYSIDTDFFDFQQKEARYIDISNDTSRGENRLSFPPDSESLGYIKRAVAFPGQDYFVVIDQVESKDSTSRSYDLFLHGGRGTMTGSGNHRLWTYSNDDYGSASKFATWIFSDGASLSNQTGELTYVKGDYGTYSYVKASKSAVKTNFMQVLIPLGSSASLPTVTELSNSTRVGGTVSKDGNLDTFLVQQGSSSVSLGNVTTDGDFAYTRYNNTVQHWAARKGTTLSYNNTELFNATARITLALDISNANQYVGRISSGSSSYNLSVRNPSGEQAQQVTFKGEQVSFTNSNGFVEISSISGSGDLVIIYDEQGSGSPVELTVQAVTASSDDGNIPENTLDKNLGTRWSANGNGEWISYDLGSSKTVGSVHVAWHNGNTRVSSFDIEVSTNNINWTQVYSGSSSGATVQLEEYSFTPVTARYIRIVGYGNSQNTWNSITEVEIYSDSEGGGSTLYYAMNGNQDSYIEAELYTLKAGNFEEVTDSSVSNGKYMQTPSGSGNDPDEHYLAYELEVTNGGSFYIHLLSTGPDGSSDSFWVAIDNGTNYQVNTGTVGWNWKKNNASISIPSGTHTLYIKVREDGAQVDKIAITQSSSSPSGQGATALTPDYR